MNDIILVYITTPSAETAKIIAQNLLEAKLIACANIHKSTSLYWWEDKITSAEEHIIIAKTREEHYEKVTKNVTEQHPYTIPCILKIQAQANENFSTWIEKQIT